MEIDAHDLINYRKVQISWKIKSLYRKEHASFFFEKNKQSWQYGLEDALLANQFSLGNKKNKTFFFIQNVCLVGTHVCTTIIESIRKSSF